MPEYSEKIRLLCYGDADYPKIMQDISEKYDILRIGNVDFVALYQFIDKLQEPKCIYWHRDETRNIQRNCEEV